MDSKHNTESDGANVKDKDALTDPSSKKAGKSSNKDAGKYDSDSSSSEDYEEKVQRPKIVRQPAKQLFLPTIK